MSECSYLVVLTKIFSYRYFHSEFLYSGRCLCQILVIIYHKDEGVFPEGSPTDIMIYQLKTVFGSCSVR